MELVLLPPIAFAIYLALVAILYGVGRIHAAPSAPSSMKSSAYASGEAAPRQMALPGYRPFFVIALFFAVLHLGALLLASGELSWFAGAYVFGLGLILLAIILK